MAEYWLDPSGNIRRMEGEQEILATVTDNLSEHEVAAILSALEIQFQSHDGIKLGVVARVSAALMRSMFRDQPHEWVSAPNEALDGRTPEDAIIEGDGEKVLNLLTFKPSV